MTKRKPKEEYLPKGRPTKWTSGINREMLAFFRKGSADFFPTFEEFAVDNDLNADTLVEWAKADNQEKYPGFSAAYQKAKDLQHSLVTKYAMTGKYAPAFSIFFAKNNMGMSDDHNHRHTGSIGFYELLDDPAYADAGDAE